MSSSNTADEAGDQYRDPTVRYDWEQQFDQQTADVRTELAHLFNDYPAEAVYTAMLQVLRATLGDRLRDAFGSDHDDYLPPRPATGETQDTEDNDSAGSES